MKKLYCLTLLFLNCIICCAQNSDSNNVIEEQIINIPNDSVIFSEAQSNSIIFENKSDIPDENIIELKDIISEDDSNTMYLRGREDAHKYYKATFPFVITFLATSPLPAIATKSLYAIPIAGITTAILFSLNKPIKLKVPYPDLLNNPDYMRGYKRKAHGKKIGKTIFGFAVGIFFDVAVLVYVFRGFQAG